MVVGGEGGERKGEGVWRERSGCGDDGHRSLRKAAAEWTGERLHPSGDMTARTFVLSLQQQETTSTREGGRVGNRSPMIDENSEQHPSAQRAPPGFLSFLVHPPAPAFLFLFFR